MSSLPPLAELTPNNQGPAVITVGYALIIVTIMFSIIRILTTLGLKRMFGWDDALLVLAVAVGLAQSILTEKSAVYGVGKHFDRLTAHQLDQFYKTSYAANILSICAQTLAKSSAIHLMSRLAAARSQLKNYCLIAHAGVLAWAIFSIFSIAFQCGLPRPWVYTSQECAGGGALWYPILILDMITDLGLSFMFAPTVWKLQMGSGQRLTVIALFGIRVVVVLAEIAQLATWAAARHKHDFTWKFVVPVIMGQVVMNLSILAAAAPSLHRFLNELTSGGGFAAGVPATQYELSQGSNNKGSRTGAAPRNWSARMKNGFNKSKTNTPIDKPYSDHDREQFRPDPTRNVNFVSSQDPKKHAEGGSELSRDGSEEMIIRQTMEYSVFDEHPQTGHSQHAR